MIRRESEDCQGASRTAGYRSDGTLSGFAGIDARTVDVFLIFNLGRLNAMPASDLGIRRGVRPPYPFTDVSSPKQSCENAESCR